MNAIPEWRWASLYQVKNSRQNARASSMERNRSGNSGRYLRVLNWASEYGLSFEVWGRECDLVTPRSARRNATGLDAWEDPRSAWMVRLSLSTPCLSMVSALSRSAILAVSRYAK